MVFFGEDLEFTMHRWITRTIAFRDSRVVGSRYHSTLWNAPSSPTESLTYAGFIYQTQEAARHGQVLQAFDLLRYMEDHTALEISPPIYVNVLRAAIESRSHEHIQKIFNYLQFSINRNSDSLKYS